MDDSEDFASFWGHLEALRKTLFRILLIIVSSIILCFAFHEPILKIFKKPLTALGSSSIEERLEYIRIQNAETKAKTLSLPARSMLSTDLSNKITAIDERTFSVDPGGALVYARIIQPELVVLGPMEGMLIVLKTSLWCGAFLSSPLWLFVLASFFLPGLHTHEKKLIVPFILVSLVFVSIGCLFACFVTIPIANQYLTAFNEGIGTNLWSLENYLNYTLFLLIANGISFEFGVIGIFAVRLQIVSAETLVSHRRLAILGAFIIAALLTPPDVLTQFLLAIPLIALYEALIIYAKLRPLPHPIKI